MIDILKNMKYYLMKERFDLVTSVNPVNFSR